MNPREIAQAEAQIDALVAKIYTLTFSGEALDAITDEIVTIENRLIAAGAR